MQNFEPFENFPLYGTCSTQDPEVGPNRAEMLTNVCLPTTLIHIDPSRWTEAEKHCVGAELVRFKNSYYANNVTLVVILSETRTHETMNWVNRTKCGQEAVTYLVRCFFVCVCVERVETKEPGAPFHHFQYACACVHHQLSVTVLRKTDNPKSRD